ncbi:MAG: hypothetical protein OXH76_09320 [Boseongicola sp.]|nr:hypothetical protein [Boseongicola sp.]MXY15587.1 hypothetical protein [Acidobacteriota bacterium]MYE10500.1 hypothetical protein [Gammaproteobacteria bacterium]
MSGVTDPRACRGLWRRVLLTVVLDLKSADRIAQRTAERWVGPHPSRDFREVCELAGFHPDRTHAALSALLPSSPKERAARIRALRHGTGEMLDAA